MSCTYNNLEGKCELYHPEINDELCVEGGGYCVCDDDPEPHCHAYDDEDDDSDFNEL